jgi:hypothetical protein
MFADDIYHAAVLDAEKPKETLSSKADPNEEMFEPRQAAVQLQSEYQRLAAVLSPADKSMQDDMVQEMSLAALQCTKPNSRKYYMYLAGWRARDYLRWWTTPIAIRESPEFQERYRNAMAKRKKAVKAPDTSPRGGVPPPALSRRERGTADKPRS